MINKRAPEIEVGIMKSGKICFRLDGNFRSEPYDSEFDGYAEAEIVDGAISILCNGSRSSFTEPLILQPIYERVSDFNIKDVLIGIGFHWEQKEEQDFRLGK